MEVARHENGRANPRRHRDSRGLRDPFPKRAKQSLTARPQFARDEIVRLAERFQSPRNGSRQPHDESDGHERKLEARLEKVVRVPCEDSKRGAGEAVHRSCRPLQQPPEEDERRHHRRAHAARTQPSGQRVCPQQRDDDHGDNTARQTQRLQEIPRNACEHRDVQPAHREKMHRTRPLK